ncbi:MAG: hypothetical protein IPQ07_02920 [Myxococcales bacterium]|nr:hypothetical protein [Myxococcales bacterium]
MLRAAVLAAVATLATLAAGAGCAHDPDKQAGPKTSTALDRRITPRTKLPAALLPLLPRNGVYVAGGGLVSSAWRVVLDLDARTLYGGSAAASNASSLGPMDKEATKDLSQRNQELLMGLANAAWNEPPSKERPDPTADYDEIFIVLEGDNTFFLEGFGPIRQPAAVKAIVELRAAAGL